MPSVLIAACWVAGVEFSGSAGFGGGRLRGAPEPFEDARFAGPGGEQDVTVPAASSERAFPSLEVLTWLAELYECGVVDLLADTSGYHERDPAQRARLALADLPRQAAGRPSGLAEVVTRLEEMDVEDLARVFASWAGTAEPGVSRRLLLKVSAGLSLAAADPAVASADDLGAAPPLVGNGYGGLDLSGIWHSRYVFRSTGRDTEFESQHYMVLRHSGDRLTGLGLLNKEGSQLWLDLSVQASVSTGSWTEQTSPAGYYTGGIYHGTIQMIVNPMGRAMAGQWLGFGKDFKVNSGEWELTWVNGSISPRAAREYHLEV